MMLATNRSEFWPGAWLVLRSSALASSLPSVTVDNILDARPLPHPDLNLILASAISPPRNSAALWLNLHAIKAVGAFSGCKIRDVDRAAGPGEDRQCKPLGQRG